MIDPDYIKCLLLFFYRCFLYRRLRRRRVQVLKMVERGYLNHSDTEVRRKSALVIVMMMAMIIIVITITIE